MIRVKVDYRLALGNLNDIERKQLPYAVSLALNRVANAAQKAEREHIKATYKLRKTDFVLKGVKITKEDRATKSTWRVIIALQYPDDRKFLAPHEQGGDKVRHGGKRLWQPNSKVFKGKIIGRANPLNPKNLALRKDATGRIVGKERTFIVKAKGKAGILVLQRTGKDRAHPGFTAMSIKRISLKNFGGPGKSGSLKRIQGRNWMGTRLLYRLVSRVHIKASLKFVSTITSTVHSQWANTVQAAMAEAVRGAK